MSDFLRHCSIIISNVLVTNDFPISDLSFCGQFQMILDNTVVYDNRLLLDDIISYASTFLHLKTSLEKEGHSHHYIIIII